MPVFGFHLKDLHIYQTKEKEAKRGISRMPSLEKELLEERVLISKDDGYEECEEDDIFKFILEEVEEKLDIPNPAPN